VKKLRDGPMKLVVDANVLVAAFYEKDKNHLRAESCLNKLAKGGHEIIVIASVLTEFVCALSKRTRPQPPSTARDHQYMAMRCSEFVRNIRGVTVQPISHAFAEKAAMFGAQFYLKGMDALVAFAAVENNCDVLTVDGDFDDIEHQVNSIGPQKDVMPDGQVITQGSSYEFDYEGRQVRLLKPEDI